MEKSKKFKEGTESSNLLDYFRKEILEQNNKRKMILFKVNNIDWVIKQGDTIFDEKSDNILEKEKGNSDEKNITYEWQSDDFYKIEDI